MKKISQEKDYSYVAELMQDVVDLRVQSSETDLTDYETPQSLGISSNIAPIPKPSKDFLISTHSTRFT